MIYSYGDNEDGLKSIFLFSSVVRANPMRLARVGGRQNFSGPLRHSVTHARRRPIR